MDTEKMLAQNAAIWAAAPTTFPVAFDADQYAEPNDDEATRELSDGEYDRIADNYERNWV